MSERIVYSMQVDDWSYSSDDEEEIAKELFDEHLTDDERKDGSVVIFKGVELSIGFADLVDIDDLIDVVADASSMEFEDFDEYDLSAVTSDQKLELTKLISCWADKHDLNPGWRNVENIEQVVFEIPDEWRNE